ncbi:hypothetical protein AAYR26_00340 (plasmid) [Bacillus licheniformis]
MSREEKIDWIIEAIWNIEGATVGRAYFDNYTNEELDEEIDWYDYLLDK